MRILFLAFRDPLNPYLGGGDIYINELAKGCAKRGHSVTFLSSRFPGSCTYENVENLHVIRLGSNFTLVFKFFIFYFLHLRGQFDVVVEEILGGPRIPFFGSLYMKERIVGIIQEKHKEIFFQQFSFPIAASLSLLERILVLLNRNKQLIVNSSRTKEDLIEMGYKAENLHIVHPGLPNYFFDLHSEGFSSRKPMVLCLTKIRRYKLIDDAVRAIEKVHKKLNNCELVIAGRTNEVELEYEDELNQLVDKLNIRGIVHFEKNICESRKINLLKQSRALVLPSAIEGFGIVVIEANACGTPAIVSDRVPADAAKDGYNAAVFPCHDLDSLSEEIISLLSDEARWNRISINSVEWAKKFTWSSSVEKFAEVIESCQQRN